MEAALVELFFMMVVLKLPVVYLFGVVWWAVRAEPSPPEGAARLVEHVPPPCPWRSPRRRSSGPRRGPRAPAARRRKVAA